jgi:hypothetical protein
LVGIPSFGRPSKIGHDGFHPLLGFCRPVCDEHGAKEREHVGVGSRSCADKTLHLGLGEVTVVLYVAGLDAFRVNNNHPRPGGEANPVRGSKISRNSRLKALRTMSLKEPVLFCSPESRRIGQQKNVSGTCRALRLQPLNEWLIARTNYVDLDPCLLSECRVERLVAAVMSSRVERELFGLGEGQRADKT